MAGYFSQEFIDRVAQANDIVRIINGYTHLTKKGPRYQGLCPFHNEKTPSFTVTPDKGLFYCFGCEEGGNIFSFIMKKENLSFVEAVEYLANLANIPLEYEKGPVDQSKQTFSQKKLIASINKEAGNFYYLQYQHSDFAKQYVHNRSISEQTAKTFALGYAPKEHDALYRFLKYRGFDDDSMLLSTLISKGKNGYYDFFRDRLMFPVLDMTKTVVGFGGRVFDSSQPKYLNSRETPLFSKKNLLYNFFRARTVKDKPLLVVEGYMDVIGLYNNGISEAVACLGTAFSESHAALIGRNAPNGVVLCFDGDEAGIKAALRSGEILTNADVYAKLLLLPNKHDPDSFIRAHGKDAFYALYDSARDYFEFRIDRFASLSDFSSVDASAKFDLLCLKMLKEEVDPLRWQYYLKRISNHSATSVKLLSDRLKNVQVQVAYPSAAGKEESEPMDKKPSKAEKALKKILAKMLADIATFQQIEKAGFSEKLIFDEANKSIYDAIKNAYKTGEKVEFSQDLCYNNMLTNKLSELTVLSPLVTMEECMDCIKTLRRMYLQNELERVKKMILSGQKEDETAEQKDLFVYFASLKTKLANIETGSDLNGRE